MQLKESGEDYLETILILENRGGPVHAVEVAAEMKVSKASVSVAMKHLRQGGYIRIGAGREILLTQQGRGLAEAVYERHPICCRGWVWTVGLRRWMPAIWSML